MPRLAMTMLVFIAFVQASPACAVGLFLPDKGRHIKLDEMRVLLIWDADKKTQALTLQPVCSGNANHFSWVVATPTKPKLHEMPRMTFDLLAAFTLLEPMDPRFAGVPEPLPFRFPPEPKPVKGKPDIRIIEPEFIGNPDYWIFEPGQAKRLTEWGEKHGYDAAVIEERLLPLLKKDWFLTIQKEDSGRYRRDKEGMFHRVSYFAPTRFLIAADQPYLPLALTGHSIKEQASLSMYAAGPVKLELRGDWSYQPAWLKKWTRAIMTAPAEKRSAAEEDWLKLAAADAADRLKALHALDKDKRVPTRLSYAKRLADEDMNVLAGKAPFTREAPRLVVQELRQLTGHLRSGQFLTRIDAVLDPRELPATVALLPAQIGGRKDEWSYTALLPVEAP